uniref:Uncharacterized protein n=1 Tax=Micrurus spixii TaxID=129469 RepID=A0A2D4MPN3_9SAUR
MDTWTAFLSRLQLAGRGRDVSERFLSFEAASLSQREKPQPSRSSQPGCFNLRGGGCKTRQVLPCPRPAGIVWGQEMASQASGGRGAPFSSLRSPESPQSLFTDIREPGGRRASAGEKEKPSRSSSEFAGRQVYFSQEFAKRRRRAEESRWSGGPRTGLVHSPQSPVRGAALGAEWSHRKGGFSLPSLQSGPGQGTRTP